LTSNWLIYWYPGDSAQRDGAYQSRYHGGFVMAYVRVPYREHPVCYPQLKWKEWSRDNVFCDAFAGQFAPQSIRLKFDHVGAYAQKCILRHALTECDRNSPSRPITLYRYTRLQSMKNGHDDDVLVKKFPQRIVFTMTINYRGAIVDGEVGDGTFVFGLNYALSVVTELCFMGEREKISDLLRWITDTYAVPDFVEIELLERLTQKVYGCGHAALGLTELFPLRIYADDVTNDAIAAAARKTSS
jgi:hypothetical protein